MIKDLVQEKFDLSTKSILESRWENSHFCQECQQKIYTKASIATNTCFRCRGDQSIQERVLDWREQQVEDRHITKNQYAEDNRI